MIPPGDDEEHRPGSDESDPSLADWVAELAERLRGGEPLDFEAYARSYPERSEHLRRLLPTIAMLSDVGTSRDQQTEWVLPPEVAQAGGPEVLGDFQILREIGRGGMGVVYEAIQISLGRRVALKVLPLGSALDARKVQRFQLEAQAVASLNHPNIVPIHSIGRDKGVPYYAMQLIDGQNLAEIIRQLRIIHHSRTTGEDVGAGSGPPTLANGRPPRGRGASELSDQTAPGSGPVPASSRPNRSTPSNPSTQAGALIRTAARLGFQAAEALAHAHELGILHRDIKPANLLVDPRGHLWVTDFGLARLQGDSELSRTGDLIGTLRYMSPEQASGRRGQIDHRTDLYSLGATLYELLTLHPAFESESRPELLQQLAQQEPTPPRRLNPAIPADLETIVRKAMAKEPAERYATAMDLAEDLRRFLDGEPIRARPIGPMSRAWRWANQPRRIRDAGWIAAGYGTMMVVWTLLSLGLILAGIMPPPDRPAEFARELVLVHILDIVPLIVLGWLTSKGRRWALWVASVAVLVRVVAQVRSFMGYPPQFGGYYEDPRFRSMTLGFLIVVSAAVLLAHLFALIASHADRETEG